MWRTPFRHCLLQVLDHNSGSATATIADTSTANLGLLLLEYRRQGRDDTGTRATERVTDSNGAAEHVDCLGVKVQQLDVGQGNNGEGLVDFVELDLIGGQTGVLNGLGNGQRRGGRELLGRVRGISPAKNLGDGLDAQLLQLGLRDEDHSRSTVINGGGIGSGDSTGAGDEDGPGSLEPVDVEVLDLIVAVDLDSGLATTTADLDGGDLGLEDACLSGGLGLLVGFDGVLILLLTRDLVGGGAQLALHTHELLLAVGVPETVLLHAVNQGAIAVLDARAQVGEVVRSVGHGLGASSHNDGRVAGHDGLSAQNDGLQPRCADLVHRRSNHGVAQASVDGALAGRCLAQAEGACQ